MTDIVVTATDQIETLGNSLIQHGELNQRIYLMKLAPSDVPQIRDELDELARARSYDKIFAKVPARFESNFLASGYRVEARIPNFYQGCEAGVFLGKYLSSERAQERRPERVQDVYRAACEKAGAGTDGQPVIDFDYTIRVAQPADINAMAELYRIVFATYPFPIDDPGYLLETMANNVIYYGVWKDEQLLALASAEIDFVAEHAEMTDFATHPAALGHGFATRLLARMEHDLRPRSIKTSYTIARAYSFGMNITFARLGYKFSGTLINNTDISGGLESMNVWYKPLMRDANPARQPDH
ncbi:MAG: putative beta-lysine N-acetyltransferase [Desulfuromonadales bacterium]|nr:putative beta-lysine N-acetyltransferase [Desulfuromonadales bacterium]MDT8423785.1 putative beta-lysine N-acetyltransferase [Desulfuromonadales bacterium]